MEKKVLVLTFSDRKNGNCSKIAEYIEQFYMRTNVQTIVISRENFAPCGDCDYECLKPGVACPALTGRQKEIMDAVCQSAVTYFVVPNYCGYPCANYFAFNERSVGYFNGDRARMTAYMDAPKRFIIVSNSEGAAFEDAMRQQTNGTPQILYLKTRKYQKQSIAGDLMTSEEAKSDLAAFLSLDNI